MNRLIEILICVGVSIPALPVFAIAMLVTYVSLGKPIFFEQVRAGKGGTTFRLYKLRTMSDARGPDGHLLPDEVRQTRTSSLFRRLRVDEIPQLLLILRGQMALVGPRPLLPQTVESFGTAGALRSSVRPGLTGWAQVSGNTTLSNEEKLRLDLWYVAHRSAALDFQILFETLGVALFGERRHSKRLEIAANWRGTHGVSNDAEASI